MDEFFVYVLRSARDGKRYIGYTSDLNRRLIEHNCGTVKSTRKRRPLTLIYRELFLTDVEARSREKFLKTGQGREFLGRLGM